MMLAPGSGSFDVVVLGATGFTGRLACEYLAERGPRGVRWAMAGRNMDKLRGVRAELPETARDVPLLQIDVTDDSALKALACSTKVVANFAGTPYLDKGLPVVAACVEQGICYVDITGEPPFMKASADRYDAKARDSGALIVHACGYDSVPSDLGAMLAANALRQRYDIGCDKIRLFVGKSAGGISGGTLHTVMHLMEHGDGADASSRSTYSLDPPGSQGGPDTGDFGEGGMLPYWNDEEKKWSAPFMMAPINARVVRRSNALSDYAYGERMSYGEAVELPGPFAGYSMVAALALGLGLLMMPLSRWLLKKTILPAPGQGPSRKTRDTGFFHIRSVASNGDFRAIAHVQSGDGGDPGYKCTARMCVESALACALDRERCHKPGGVVTPAFGLGQVLVDRLNATGMQLYVEDP